MNKRVATVVSLIVLSSVLSTPAFSAVKAGATCKKIGSISTSAGKKFTCVKSGKKLVWDKGVLVTKPISSPTPSPKPSPLPTPSASPTPTPTPTEVVKDLSQSPAISTSFQYSNINTCKISDATLRPDTSNGFPRPSGVFADKTSAKILLLPVSFSDFVFDETDLARVKRSLDEMSNNYKGLSYGKFSLVFEIPDKLKWITMSGTADSYNLVNVQPQQNNSAFVEKLFLQSDLAINFDNYDAVILETANFRSSGGGQGFPGTEFKTRNGIAKRVSLESGENAGRSYVITHELGHTLFGLEDLYVFQNINKPTPPDVQPAGPWDLMSSGNSLNFFGWTRFLNGWIEDSEVNCVTSQESLTLYLNDVSSLKSVKKLLLLAGNPGVIVGAEVRSNPKCVTQDKCFGLLLYNVNTNIPHGDGPIVAQKTLLFPGEVAVWDKYEFRVIDYDANGLLVSVQGTK
jgi:M6 family metalloprotease-like protein